jgi:putative membrane protein
MDLLFQHQERLLLRAIMNPAMIATWVLGLLLCASGGWWDAGLAPREARGVVALTAFHMWLAARRRDFAAGAQHARAAPTAS